ncbi:MAG: pilus assembly protein CpaF, partial [Magnetospirillum sp.]|nr:pilus assembly protein CpaF [Magnetospirillum sp.]
MIYRISVDCFALSPELAEVFKAVRDDRSMGRSRVSVIAGGLPAAVAHYDGQPTPQVVIVEEEDDDDTMLARLEALAEVCEPGTKVVVIGTLNDIGLYRTLVGRGISEYLVRPVTARQLLDTVAGLFSDPGAAPRGKVVAVWGARGGVGASTIAQNLAWCLADGLAEDVVYIDLDLAFGTSVLAFNLDTKQTVADALANPDRLDQVLMDRFLVEYGDHLQVLPSPGDPRAAARIEVEAVDRLLDLASRMGAMVVVDVPHLWADWVEHLLTNADELVVVATPDLFCLRDTKTRVDLMTQRRGVSVPIRVVVNRREA